MQQQADAIVGTIAGNSDLTAFDAVALATAYRRLELSPVEVAHAVLARLAAVEPTINAFVHVDPATTLAMAAASETRWRAGTPFDLLDGVPVTIKDLVPVAGWPLRRGSLAYDPAVPAPEDAPCVARLREAGCVFVGKTTTPDAGSKIITRSAVHGETANPWDLSRTPGGSSGGAAAALACGVAPLAVGTDGAGSIRIPAAHCNIVGLKPSFGRVPIHPTSLFMPHSVIGPMGRRTADVALMLDVMARADRRDPFALTVPFEVEAATRPGLEGLRLAFSTTLGLPVQVMDPQIEAAVAGAADALDAAGAQLTVEDPIWPDNVLETFLVFWEAVYAAYLETFPPAQRERVDPDLLDIGARGADVSAVALLGAVAARNTMTAVAKAFFDRFDVLIGPVTPLPPQRLGLDQPPGTSGEWDWCPFTYPWNMTGQPAISVPCGFTADGLPIGCQLVAWIGREDALLRVAAALENALGPRTQRQPPLLRARS